jgi:hypothetical protein
MLDLILNSNKKSVGSKKQQRAQGAKKQDNKNEFDEVRKSNCYKNKSFYYSLSFKYVRI